MLVLLLLTVVCLAAPVLGQRNVVATLEVDNGERWGEWHQDDFCPTGTYVYSYRLRFEDPCGLLCDNTALNGFRFECKRPQSSTHENSISSQIGMWGEWRDPRSCIEVDGISFFFTRFQLRVHSRTLVGDNTAANDINFFCSDLPGTASYELAGNGGTNGDWGGWTDSCPPNSAICGMNTKIEGPQWTLGDDTSLNDVRFFCCDD